MEICFWREKRLEEFLSHYLPKSVTWKLKTDPLVTCIIWNFKTKFAKYDCYKLFGVCLVEKPWIVLQHCISNKVTCVFAHVGFGVHRVKNTQFHQVISFTIITSNKWELSGRTHFRQVYLNTKPFINWVYFKRIIVMCFLCGFWGTYTCTIP